MSLTIDFTVINEMEALSTLANAKHCTYNVITRYVITVTSMKPRGAYMCPKSQSALIQNIASAGVDSIHVLNQCGLNAVD